MTDVKRCPRCGQLKSADQFYRRRHSTRLSPYCRPCQRAAARTAQARRRSDPASLGLLRALDRTRQRRHRTLHRQGGGDR